MKLMRHGPRGQEQPACVAADGSLRDLRPVLPDLRAEDLTPEGLARLRAIDPMDLPRLAQPGKPAVPWAGLGKFLCIGLNYADHAAEAGAAIPAEPILFMKPNSAAVGAERDLVMPLDATKMDWEVELGVVIGRRARAVTPEQALAHVAGYCIVNDVSERAFQMERGGTWDKGKGCDTFGPIGPWLVTADEVPDPQALALELDLNGQPMQRGNTATMIFGVAHIVSYLSRFMTLEPGDLIATGTPPGVGMGQKPPRWLQPGDTLRLSITGLGEQRQRVVPWSEAALDAE